MTINVKGIFTYNDNNFNRYNITNELYENTILIANIEKNNKISSLLFKNYTKYYCNHDYNIDYKTAFEIINSINSSKYSNNRRFDENSITNQKHRCNFNFTSELQKQIFINNYVFTNNEKFIKSLISNNIDIESLEELIININNKKKQAKVNKDYILDISDIFPIERICNYYKFNKPELIINKIMEIRYLYPELLGKLNKNKTKKIKL